MEPLILLIEPELDERAATATMSRAQKVYEEGARDISRVMRQQITEGTTAAGRGFDDLETKARRAYLGMQDASEKVAAAERKYESAKERGASNAEALGRRVERARLDEIQAIERASSAYRDYGTAAERATTSAARFGTTLGAGFREAVGDGVRSATAQLGPMGAAADVVLSGMSGRAATAALGIAGIGVAAVATGKQLYDLGSMWDDIGDGIAIRTGKLGDDLTSMTSMVRDLGAVTAAPLTSIGDIAGQVSQAMNLTGNDLFKVTQTIANLNEMTGEQANIRELGKSFRLFDVSGEDQVAALDGLFNASQATGISVNELATAMTTAGKSASQFGLGFGETAALLSIFEQAGVDVGRVAPSMTIALRNFANAGREPQAALRDTITEIKSLSDAGREAESVALASETFGRGYIDFFNVIKDGTLDADALNDALKATGPSIDEMRDATADWSEEWQTLKNNMSGVFAPAAEFVFGQVNHHLDQAGTAMSGFGDWITGIGHAWEQFAALVEGNPINVNVVTGATMLGPNGQQIPATPGPGQNPLDIFAGQGGAGAPGSLDDALGLPPGTIGATGIPAPRAGAAGGSIGTGLPTGPVSPWSGRAIPQGASGGGSATSLPDAPLVPLEYTNTAGLPTQIANAQTRVDETRHAVAEKQARVNQLEQSNVATAEDIQKARNDLAKVNQDQLQAERALNDARISATEKANKQLTGLSNDLSEMGNQLDADFGLSKGLGGFIENVVKAFGNALTAPLMAALGMVEKANPNEGSGLIGIGAANGMFGSQYTPASIAAMQMSSTGGVPAGYAGGGANPIYGAPAAAQPGQSAREFAHEAMLPFFEQQGFTVGDHQADRYGEHQNGALDIMVDSIAEGNAVLQQVLADPNAYGAIFNNQAYGYGQGSEGRPYSGGFTGNPTQDHQDHVHVFYQPGGANNIGPAGGGGGGGVSIPALSAPSPAYPGVSPGLPTSAPGGAWFPGIGMPQSPVFGGGMPGIGTGIGQAGSPGIPQPGVGAAIGAGQGGSAYPSTGGNSGNMLGGMAMDGLMAATAGLDMMMPGAGAAAKIGIQLANRTVGYAAQNAGIIGSGVLETLSLGDNPKGSLGASWLGKGLGGIAGAAAALPNIAGQKPPGPMDQAGGGQAGGNTTIDQSDRSINVKNEKATEDQTGKVIAEHQMAMQAPAGRQP